MCYKNASLFYFCLKYVEGVSIFLALLKWFKHLFILCIIHLLTHSEYDQKKLDMQRLLDERSRGAPFPMGRTIDHLLRNVFETCVWSVLSPYPANCVLIFQRISVVALQRCAVLSRTTAPVEQTHSVRNAATAV